MTEKQRRLKKFISSENPRLCLKCGYTSDIISTIRHVCGYHIKFDHSPPRPVKYPDQMEIDGEGSQSEMEIPVSSSDSESSSSEDDIQGKKKGKIIVNVNVHSNNRHKSAKKKSKSKRKKRRSNSKTKSRSKSKDRKLKGKLRSDLKSRRKLFSTSQESTAPSEEVIQEPPPSVQVIQDPPTSPLPQGAAFLHPPMPKNDEDVLNDADFAAIEAKFNFKLQNIKSAKFEISFKIFSTTTSMLSPGLPL